MDRIRNLIYRVDNSNNDMTYQDDQSTVFDNPLDGLSLRTTLSESSTIGDLTRLGYLNNCPKFLSKRDILFISIILQKGFFAFSSELSFKTFLMNKRRFDKWSSKSQVGLPLFHAITLSIMKTMFNRSLPIMKIYKFEVIKKQSVSTLFENCSHPYEIISTNEDGDILVKWEFVKIFRIVLNDTCRVEHKFIFNKGLFIDETESISMLNHIQWRNTDTKLCDLNLKWLGTTGFASPFGSGSFRLLVLDLEMPSLIDQENDDEYRQQYRSRRFRRLSSLPTWAIYSDKSGTIIPKKRTLKLATFTIGELDEFINDNFSGISWNTQVLTCMCMVLHDYESRKDKRTPTIRNSPLGPFIGLDGIMGSGVLNVI